jgi:hypothetical protein
MSHGLPTPEPNSKDPRTYLAITERSYRECLAIQREIEILLTKPLPTRLREGVVTLGEVTQIIRQAADLGRDIARRSLQVDTHS